MSIGKKMYTFMESLFNIPRSLSGSGVRETLSRIKNELIPELELIELPTGTKCFDWEVPPEWEVEEAYIITPQGEKICDYKENYLHLVGYSRPFEGELTLEELQNHLHSIPDQPDAIPYVTSYYKDYWGFCIRHKDRQRLKEGKYKVVVKTKLFEGSITIGEAVIKGESDKEVLFSTYTCHPNLANDNLSGVIVNAFLANYVKAIKNRKYTYRFVFLPETIGSICYIALKLKEIKDKVVAGFVLTCLGYGEHFSYLQSRKGNTMADRVVLHLLKHLYPGQYKVYSYLHRGSDERQYCWPSIDLPVCSVMRAKYGEYKEYHTSLDNMKLISPERLEESLNFYKKVVEALELNGYYITQVICEPMLSKRNLYPPISRKDADYSFSKLLVDILAYCDGSEDLLQIAERLGVCITELKEPIAILTQEGLIRCER